MTRGRPADLILPGPGRSPGPAPGTPCSPPWPCPTSAGISAARRSAWSDAGQPGLQRPQRPQKPQNPQRPQRT